MHLRSPTAASGDVAWSSHLWLLVSTLLFLYFPSLILLLFNRFNIFAAFVSGILGLRQRVIFIIRGRSVEIGSYLFKDPFFGNTLYDREVAGEQEGL